MARTAVGDGIHTIVATPHTLNGIYINPVKEVTSRVTALQETLSKNHIPLNLHAGAEVHLCPHMLEYIENGDALTINNAGKYIILEFPPHIVPPGVKDEIFSLKLNGITPIISHPERNAVIQNNVDIMYGLVSMGALSQVTAMSITGDFGGMVMQCAERLLKHRLIHIIASDAHSSDSRPPVLSQAVEAAAEILGNYDDAERMVTEVPASILSGDMPDIPSPKRAK
ncbi:MAG: tyrosine protein phosphatase [Deltaproteobacteria bacterium]|nr:tyrosine protein phosphatase [Deltaproteobacteria bacterium]